MSVDPSPIRPLQDFGFAGRGPRDLAALQRHLRTAETIPELLRQGCAAAASWCGFDRALILTLDRGVMSASLLGALPDPASDALRRRALANPVPLEPGSLEVELIRQAEGGRLSSVSDRSRLQDELDLGQFALGTIVPEERVLGLLMVDRDAPRVEQAERDLIQLLAQVLALSIERLVLRLRMQELSQELRHLTESARAVMQEALEAPVTMPVDYGAGPVFQTIYPVPQPAPDSVRELLTARELQIAQQLVAGRSNREIAAQLHLSPETVKGYVGRVLRKLGASNRADAVSRYLRMSATGDG
jgi:LuxR family transcriptional regulator, regulator of acetate metabolism